MPLPFALDHINLWLLEDGDGWTVVDTGFKHEPIRGHWRDVIERMYIPFDDERQRRRRASARLLASHSLLLAVGADQEPDARAHQTGSCPSRAEPKTHHFAYTCALWRTFSHPSLARILRGHPGARR